MLRPDRGGRICLPPKKKAPAIIPASGRNDGRSRAAAGLGQLSHQGWLLGTDAALECSPHGFMNTHAVVSFD